MHKNSLWFGCKNFIENFAAFSCLALYLCSALLLLLMASKKIQKSYELALVVMIFIFETAVGLLTYQSKIINFTFKIEDLAVKFFEIIIPSIYIIKTSFIALISKLTAIKGMNFILYPIFVGNFFIIYGTLLALIEIKLHQKSNDVLSYICVLCFKINFCESVSDQ